MKIENKAYALARLPIGFSFLGHGLVRIPKISKFAQGMAESFNETILPHDFVLAFAYVLPFFELLLGIFLILGITMHKSSFAGIILVCILIFGSSLQENWSAVATQMFYGLYFSILYLFAAYNGYAIIKTQNDLTKHI